MTYDEIKNMFETSRKRKLDHNTYIVKHDDYYAVQLHTTEIIKFYPDKTVLDSGGWLTPTTKDRLNKFSGFSICQKARVWYIGCITNNIIFADGITYKDGVWSNRGESPKKIAKLQKRVKDYVKKYIEALQNNKVPAPSDGDCFFCHMVTVDEPHVSLGEKTKDGGHILSHIEENYFVPSLLMNAIRVFPVSEAAKWYIGSLWGHPTDVGCFKDIAVQQIEKSIYRFCLRQLEIG